MNPRFIEQDRSSRAKGLPLSIAQERLWVLEQLHPRNAIQNVACGLRLTEQLDRTSLEAAFHEVVERHEILRTGFREQDGTPVQMVRAARPMRLNVVDLRKVPVEKRENELLRLRQEETKRPFELEHEPLLRATLFELSEREHILMVTAHRIVCDELSARNLLREIYSGYGAAVAGKPRIPAEILPYGDGVVEHAAPSPADVSYWKQLLKGAPSSIELPTDRPRPAAQSFRGATQEISIEGSLLERLRALGQAHGADLFAPLVAAFSVLLSRYSRQDDLVVGTRVSGRGRPELENVIGPLENMLALRIDTSGEPNFSDLIARVQATAQAAFAHESVPFETVVKQMRLERDMSRHPLFQVLFNVRTAAGDTDLSFIEVENPAEQFDLELELKPEHDQLRAVFRYSPDLFDAATIERMAAQFGMLLESASAEPSCPISLMRMLSDAERRKLLVEWNATRVDYPRNIPLHKFIEDQVERTPDATALVYESQQLTYRELNHRANQLAHYLQKNGVGPDVLVGVCAERSLEMVIALLACIKAGGAYVPLDPEYPKDRLEAMVQDANPPVVLTQAQLLDRLPANARRVFCLDRDWPSLRGESIENPEAAIGVTNLAYAIYTSGSTGKPKGVPNVHEGIVNRLLWMQDEYKLTAKDRVLQKTPFSFDVSVWEFFWPLLSGATLVVAKAGGHRDPAYLVNLIAEQGITTLHFVPSMLSIFLETGGLERCRSIRQVMASGEALPFELQQRFFQRMTGTKLHNLYGPTEAAVDVTYWECRPDSGRSIVPIGRPIANTQIYILDSKLQPTPIGGPGELHIGGIGLARGYLNRPELTAEKFIPDPFSSTPGARLYKTGDLARFLPDGNIEYLGRIDFQVKLRGFRIELGEIEAVLGECAGVRQAAVVVREDIPGDKRLVAYVIPTGGDPQIENLKRELQGKLPEYMVPSRFVVVESFPMTTSGKVDRKALPAPILERDTQAEMVAPRTELEARLTQLFAGVLGLPSVGVTDNFFDLGGHSLLASRLLAQINQATGRQLPLSALFRAATVESLAHVISGETESAHEPVVMAIQPGDGSRLPFFAIVPPGEESLGYAMLARHMGPQQAVYKIQGHAPVLDGSRPHTPEELQQLTDEYVAAIRSVQPHGPYCMGGFCDGTHIAEQIILKLESEGEEVGLFAIFDTWVMQHSQIRWLWKVDHYWRRLQEMKKLSLSEKLASYKHAAQVRVLDATGQKPARTDWRERYWPQNFTPRQFRAPVVLFKRPKQQFYYVNDREMGWGKRSESGVEIHEIEFHHGNILREPHVRQFGEVLAEWMARISLRSSQLQSSAEHESLTASGSQVQGRS